MSVSSERIDAVIREHVRPAMKGFGFKKSARSWFLDEDEAVKVVNLQGSSWSGDEVARFTINLGVWFPSITDLTGQPPVPNRRPPEYRCTVRQRIGHVRPERIDWWWDVTSDQDVDAAGRDALATLEEFGVPWLHDVGTPEGAIRHLVTTDYAGHSPVAAFAPAMQYEGIEAAARLYRAWFSEDRPTNKIDDWAAQHGLVSEV